MKRAFRRERPLLLAAASLFLYSGATWADGTGSNPSSPDDSGFTVLSNATNVTHWGLGVGAGISASPYKSGDTKYTPIPLIAFEDKWVHAFGTTIDLKVGTWDHVTVMLRGDYAIGDGYKGSDAPILNGMETRNGTFWYGPALAWHTAFGTLSGDYLLGGNRGERAQVAFSKQFQYGRFSVEPRAAVEWLSSDYVDYYYGVRSSEVRADRPEYSGKAAYDMSLGTRFGYHFTRQQSAMLDVGIAHYTSGISDSPIVGRQYIPQIRLGYVYEFK